MYRGGSGVGVVGRREAVTADQMTRRCELGKVEANEGDAIRQGEPLTDAALWPFARGCKGLPYNPAAAWRAA